MITQSEFQITASAHLIHIEVKLYSLLDNTNVINPRIKQNNDMFRR